ncbi:MAG TPA: hypothetical protein VHD61_02010 [Lacunisphaera sp.]|nr:hypothetical protein [Lacunisphaera sp.]
MQKIKVAQFGLGPIGLESLRYAAEQPWIEIVGAVDHDPEKYGRSLVDLTGLPMLDGLSLCPTLEELFRETQPDVILHTASSQAAETLRQVRPALELGLAVATTCEEMIYPAARSPGLAKEIGVLCLYTKSRLVATGVNPGFVMDLLPVCFSSVCRTVESIQVRRIVDAATRRRSLQAKVGAGQDPNEFRTRLATGEAGHAGLRESAALLAHVMGWKLDDLSESGEPVIAERDLATEFFRIPAGRTCGIHQRVVGREGGRERVHLDLRMYVDAPEPRDEIRLTGRPGMHAVLPGGVAGDDATVAALIHVVPRLLASPPGFRLLHELAAPAWTNGEK